MGIAYHAGTLKAISDAGMDPGAADLIVGTSAGAIVGSIVRVGHDLDEVWDLAHADENPFVDDQPFFRPDVVFRQGWRTPMGLYRRVVGSGYVLNRMLVRWPVMTPPRPLARFYRAGLGSATEQRVEFENWTQPDWPDGALALCTFDIVTGQRVVLGAPSPKRPPLPDAMRASSAVPLLYPPVRVGRRLLIDGAITSSTNVDVAVAAGAERIVVVAPQAYDHDDPPSCALRASKELFDRRLDTELASAREAGIDLLVVRPSAEEADLHGFNLLRSEGNGEVANVAHRRCAALLRTDDGRSFARRWRAANRAAARAAGPDAARPRRTLAR